MYSVDESYIAAPPFAPPVQRTVGQHLAITDAGVVFVDPRRAASQPSVWIEAFRVAITSGCAVSEPVLAAIREQVGRLSADDFVGTRGERQQLRKMLHPRPGLHARLVEMRRCGLLAVVFPEPRPIQDSALEAIRALEALRQAKHGSSGRFRAVLDEVNAPELLTLALLLDRPADEAGQNVHRVRPALDRLQLTGEAKESVEFLIGQRAEMARTAFKRDATDSSVIDTLARVAGTEQRLKMLCLMQLVRVQADPDDRAGVWKEDLLWRLYVESRQRVMLGHAPRTGGDNAARAVVLAGRPSDIPEDELARFLDGVPERYVAIFGLAAAYDHVRLARGIQPDQIQAALERHEDLWRLTIVSLGRRQLFSLAAGVLSYFGMNIHRAQALTTPDDLVLDVFEFSDEEGFLASTAEGQSEIDRVLKGVVDGSIDLTALLDPGGRVRAVREPAVIHLGLERSDRCTIVEIDAEDAPGLLHRVCGTIAAFGCDVDLALIATEGTRAHDLLHITKRGSRLRESDRFALAARLEDALG